MTYTRIKDVKVQVFNNRYEWIQTEDGEAAVQKLIDGVARRLYETGVVKVAASVNQTFKITNGIILNRYVKPPTPSGRWTKEGVLKRDKYTCAYCGVRVGDINQKTGEVYRKRGENGFTVDHVKPKSQGGQDTWKNTVCACFECNQRKGPRTPAQAGMSMAWKGHRPPSMAAGGKYQEMVNKHEEEMLRALEAEIEAEEAELAEAFFSEVINE